MPPDNNDNLRKLAARKKQPRIPTAEEEALQDPTIDPVMFAALGATMGPMAAGKQLIQQIGMNELFQGVPEGIKRLSQYLPAATNRTVLQAGEKMTSLQPDLDSGIVSPKHYGALLKASFPNSSAAKKIADILDRTVAGPENYMSDRAAQKAIDELIKSGEWAKRMKPPL